MPIDRSASLRSAGLHLTRRADSGLSLRDVPMAELDKMPSPKQFLARMSLPKLIQGIVAQQGKNMQPPVDRTFLLYPIPKK
jgi:hypothetical protein